MNNITFSNYKNPIIIGLGRTGMSVARYFMRCQQRFSVIDTRDVPPGLAEFEKLFPEVSCTLGSMPIDMLLQSDLLVVSPGVDLDSPSLKKAKADGINIVNDIGLFLAQIESPIIAVTGTNGKSTVCAALGHILTSAGLRVCVAGNIGVPVLDTLANPKPDYYILEISSFQLELLDNLSAKVAVCLNISPDHLDRHHNMNNYIALKQKIYNGCEHAVVNIDAEYIWKSLSGTSTVSGFTVAAHCSQPQRFTAVSGIENDTSKVISNKKSNRIISESYLSLNQQPYLPLSKVAAALLNPPQNAVAVLAILSAIPIDISSSSLKLAFASFTALEHRCHLVNSGWSDFNPDQVKQHLHWYNDSKATNIGSAQSSLQSVSDREQQKLIWIAGGQSKGVNLQVLCPAIKNYVAAMVVIGSDAGLFADLAASCDIPCTHANAMDDVVTKAVALASQTKTNAILLAPACASFDQYDNFQDRGEQFECAIKKWVK